MKRFKDWKKPIFDIDGWAYPTNDIFYKGYGWRCQHSEGLKLGESIDIGCFTYLNAKYGIEIGDDVQIGSQCSIYSENTENNTKGPVIIGKGSNIGSHSLILPNVIIPKNTNINAFGIVMNIDGETIYIKPGKERKIKL